MIKVQEELFMPTVLFRKMFFHKLFAFAVKKSYPAPMTNLDTFKRQANTAAGDPRVLALKTGYENALNARLKSGGIKPADQKIPPGIRIGSLVQYSEKGQRRYLLVTGILYNEKEKISGIDGYSVIFNADQKRPSGTHVRYTLSLDKDICEKGFGFRMPEQRNMAHVNCENHVTLRRSHETTDLARFPSLIEEVWTPVSPESALVDKIILCCITRRIAFLLDCSDENTTTDFYTLKTSTDFDFRSRYGIIIGGVRDNEKALTARGFRRDSSDDDSYFPYDLPDPPTRLGSERDNQVPRWKTKIWLPYAHKSLGKEDTVTVTDLNNFHMAVAAYIRETRKNGSATLFPTIDGDNSFIQWREKVASFLERLSERSSGLENSPV